MPHPEEHRVAMRLEGSATWRLFPPFETRPTAAPQGEAFDVNASCASRPRALLAARWTASRQGRERRDPNRVFLISELSGADQAMKRLSRAVAWVVGWAVHLRR